MWSALSQRRQGARHPPGRVDPRNRAEHQGDEQAPAQERHDRRRDLGATLMLRPQTQRGRGEQPGDEPIMPPVEQPVEAGYEEAPAMPPLEAAPTADEPAMPPLEAPPAEAAEQPELADAFEAEMAVRAPDDGFTEEITGSGPVDILVATLGKALKVERARKTLFEYVDQGGVVGYVIIGLGIIGLLIALWRWLYLGGVGANLLPGVRIGRNAIVGAGSENNGVKPILSITTKKGVAQFGRTVLFLKKQAERMFLCAIMVAKPAALNPQATINLKAFTLVREN